MLLEFSCSNHKSIKEEITFSALASNDTEHQEQILTFEKNKVLRTAVIYGANGSGKTNFIDAIAFTKQLVINSINHQPGALILQRPHKLLSSSDESTYCIQFEKNNKLYSYGFSLIDGLVNEEYLFYFPNGRKVIIFERTGNSYEAGNKFKGKFDSCIDAFKENRLFLSVAANFSAVEEIREAFEFFVSDLVIYRGLGSDNWVNISLMEMGKRPDIKDAVVKLLRQLGSDIKDIIIKLSDGPIVLPPLFPEELKNLLQQQTATKIEAKVIYDEFSIDLSEESTGVKKMLEFLYPFIEIMKGDKVIICDELENNLHESVVSSLIKMLSELGKEKRSQLIFSTHNTSLLKLDIFRRDQIWFTEMKSKGRATDMYSLAEKKNVRKDENICKGYITGKYGAIPMLNDTFAEFIRSI